MTPSMFVMLFNSNMTEIKKCQEEQREKKDSGVKAQSTKRKTEQSQRWIVHGKLPWLNDLIN